MGYVYHTYDDFRCLGEQVRDTAIRVTMTHDNQYGFAQQNAANYPSKVTTGKMRPYAGYTPPAYGKTPDEGDLRAFVTAEFAEVPDWFTAFSMPDPGRADGSVEALFRTTMSLMSELTLKTGDEKVFYPFPIGDATPAWPLRETAEQIELRLEHWRGSAADSFRSYLARFDTVSESQRNIAFALAVTLESTLEINRRIMTDVWELGQTAIRALEDLDQLHCPTRGGAAMTFTVVGAVAAVVAGMLTAGTATAGLVVGVIGGVQATGSVLSTGGPYTVTQPLAGITVPEVLRSVQQKLGQIPQFAASEQQKVVGTLRNTIEQLGLYRDSVELGPPLGDTDLSNATRTDLDINGGGAFFDR